MHERNNRKLLFDFNISAFKCKYIQHILLKERKGLSKIYIDNHTRNIENYLISIL